MNFVTDRELIEGCIKEEKDCQEELFRRYAGKMLVVCMRYARHQMEAEDNGGLNCFITLVAFTGWCMV